MSTLRFPRAFVVWRRVFVAVITAASATVSAAGIAGATAPPVGGPVREGDVVIVNPNARAKEITHGTGNTPFSLRLPEGAVCPGDSANDQWRVQSFLLPDGDDPTAVRYGPIGPEPVGHGRYAMFGVDTTPFVHQLTRPNPAAGSPGVIAPLPAFSLAVVAGEQIPTGQYHLGVSCTSFGATVKYWDTQIAITDPPGGSAGALVWRLPNVPESVATGGDDTTSTAWLAVVIGAAAAIGFLILLVRRGSRRVLMLSEEPQ